MNLALLIVAAVAALFALAFSLRYYTHMLQLESYHLDGFHRFLMGKHARFAIISGLPSVVPFILVHTADHSALSLIVSIVISLTTIVLFIPQKAKKPFVFTMRVMRLYICYTVVWLVISLILTAIFGFSHMIYAFHNVSLLLTVLSPFFVYLANLACAPVEKLVANHFIREAKAIIAERKKRGNLTVIGITGSFGKTSTKYFLTRILSERYHVLMTPGSYNTTMGVVRVVREMLKPSHEIFICEMGARNIGDIKEICDIVLPDYGIITSVGPQHLETFKTMDNIVKTKWELADAVSDKSHLAICADSEYLYEKRYDENCNYYGVVNDKARYFVDKSTLSPQGTDFVISYDGKKLSLNTKLVGQHNIQNIAACIALAKLFDVSDDDIREAVSHLEPVPHRLQLIHAGNLAVLDDSFNSNPTGSKMALEVLSSFDGIKVLVTPGMVELGEQTAELNRAFGKQAGELCDYIYAVGNENREYLRMGAEESGFDTEKNFFTVSSPTEAIAHVKAFAAISPVVVLIENDLPDNFR